MGVMGWGELQVWETFTLGEKILKFIFSVLEKAPPSRVNCCLY